MAVWSPRSPTFAGLDWPVVREGGVVLDTAQHALAVRIHSTAAETINNFSTYIDKIIGDNPTLKLDIWPLANLPEIGSGGTNDYNPSGDVSLTAGIVGVPTDTVGNRYTNIDEGIIASATDYLDITSPASEQRQYRFHINSGAGLGAGAQNVSGVRIRVHGRSYGTVPLTGQVVLGLEDGAGNNVYSETIAVTPPTADAEFIDYTFTTGPGGQPLTEAFIVGLAAGTAAVLFAWQGVGSDKNIHVNRILVSVTYTNEFRVVSAAQATPTGVGWLTFPFSNWAKANGTDYVAVIRRITGGTAVIPVFDSNAAHPSGHGSYDLDISGAGVITALNPLKTEVPPLVLHTTAPAASVDSSDYADLRLETLFAGKTIVQEITEPSGATRGLLQVVAAGMSFDGPGAALIGRIKRTSDGVQMGGDATFDPSLIADDYLALHVLQQTMAATGVLVNGTQYDLELSSAASSDRAWVVAIFDAKTPPVSATLQGFGGTTDRGEVATIESDDLDLPGALVATVPAAPTGLGAAATLVAGIGGIILTWTATALVGSFGGYVIEKQIGTVWYPVAFVTIEGTVTWTDWEPAVGSSTSYRIRVLHSNGTFSLPSATASATAAGSSYTLTSNRLSSLNQIVKVKTPFALQKPREQKKNTHFGRRFQTLVSSPYDRGLVVPGKIHVNVTGANRGLRMTDGVQALIDASVPYLCLRDPFGAVKFVGLVHDAAEHQMTTYGLADVEFVELTQIPDEVVI